MTGILNMTDTPRPVANTRTLEGGEHGHPSPTGFGSDTDLRIGNIPDGIRIARRVD